MLPKRRLKKCSVRSCWLCSCCDGLMTLHENMDPELRPTMLWNTPQRQRVIVSWKASCWSQLMSSFLLSGVEMMMATHQMTSTGKQRSCQVDHQTAAFAAYLFIYLFIHSFIWTSACSAVEFWVYFLLNIEVAQWWFVKGGFNPSVLCVVSAKVTLTAAINNKPNFN